MKIHEYQGKKIFSDYDMPVQDGYTFDNIDKAEEVINKVMVDFKTSDVVITFAPV